MRKLYLLIAFLAGTLYCRSQVKIKVACIGNSVTYGYGLKEPSTESYPAQLQKLLGGKYEVRNFGHSGATLLRKGHNPYDKTEAFQKALAFHADIVVIHLGLNDTDPRNWPNYRDEFAIDYKWLIDTERRVNPKVKIYICEMTPVFSGHPRFLSGTRNWFWQIQELIPKIAKANHTGLIDLHKPLYSRPDLFADYLHPDREGAGIIAKTVCQKLTGDYGGFQLSSVFASHMVLQRNTPIQFFGVANAGGKVTVTFNGKIKTTVADEDGNWQAIFDALPAGGPFRASFQCGGKKIFLDDILIGEVWLCSGQSNMYFQLKQDAQEKNEMLPSEKNIALRFLKMNLIAETDNEPWDSSILNKVNQLKYFSGTWHRCDSINAKEFSAVAYYFGAQLQRELGVPIGLIEVAVGGSPAESWIDRYTMEHDNLLVNELTKWRTTDFLMPWVRERADTNLKMASNKLQRHPYQPCYNFDAGISHFTGFPIAGVIWYQGESNAHNAVLYDHLFPVLVNSWRKQWGYDFPFYYVQLSSINRPSWTYFRYMQSKLTLNVPNSGMAVSSDVGNPTNVHPTNKKPVGERLARLALHYAYQKTHIVPSGPVPLKAVTSGNNIVVSFNFEKGLRTGDGKPIRGFKLMDEQGNLVNVKATIKNEQVVISLGSLKGIVEVRYGWEPFTDANLVNGVGMPASTFRLVIQ